jgi:hypothetical protein
MPQGIPAVSWGIGAIAAGRIAAAAIAATAALTAETAVAAVISQKF